MRILVTGGGTGGHVTPLRPIISSLKEAYPSSIIIFASQKGDRFAAMLDEHPDVDERVSFVSGKWRRYPNRTMRQKVQDISTILYNIRDILFVGFGCLQAIVYLAINRPDIIFSKSGPASIPLGVVARVYGIPVITHDSDLIPGWTHSLIGRWARYNAVGSKAGSYPGYASDKLKVVGVPVGAAYSQPVSKKARDQARKACGVKGVTPLVFVLGGSLGAKAINDALISRAEDYIQAGYKVVHVSGEKNYEDAKSKLDEKGIASDNYQLIRFLADPDQVFQYYIASDVVVTRGGATNTAEVANLGKAAVIIPAKQLVDQIQNAKYLSKINAAHILQDSDIEEDPKSLYEGVKKIINDKKYRESLQHSIKKIAIPDTASRITTLVRDILGKA